MRVICLESVVNQFSETQLPSFANNPSCADQTGFREKGLSSDPLPPTGESPPEDAPLFPPATARENLRLPRARGSAVRCCAVFRLHPRLSQRHGVASCELDQDPLSTVGDELLVFVWAQRFHDVMLFPSAGRTTSHATLHGIQNNTTPVTLLQHQDISLSCWSFWEQRSSLTGTRSPIVTRPTLRRPDWVQYTSLATETAFSVLESGSSSLGQRRVASRVTARAISTGPAL